MPLAKPMNNQPRRRPRTGACSASVAALTHTQRLLAWRLMRHCSGTPPVPPPTTPVAAAAARAARSDRCRVSPSAPPVAGGCGQRGAGGLVARATVATAAAALQQARMHEILKLTPYVRIECKRAGQVPGVRSSTHPPGLLSPAAGGNTAPAPMAKDGLIRGGGARLQSRNRHAKSSQPESGSKLSPFSEETSRQTASMRAHVGACVLVHGDATRIFPSCGLVSWSQPAIWLTSPTNRRTLHWRTTGGGGATRH